MLDIKHTRIRAPLIYCLIPLCLGITLARALPLELSTWQFISCITVCACALRSAKRSAHLWLMSFMLSSVWIFWLYGSIHLPHPPSDKFQKLPPREAQITFQISQIIREQDVYGRTLAIAKVHNAPPLCRITQGSKIYVEIRNPIEQSHKILRSQILEATGILQALSVHTAENKQNSFHNYLYSNGTYYRFSRINTYKKLKEAHLFFRFCSHMNRKFQQILQHGGAELTSESRIYRAILLGQKSALSSDQNKQFSSTGTMHFFAISGLHIGVIATIIAQLLSILRTPPQWAPIIGLPIVFLYVQITGGSPSAVRAFIMATFFWAAFSLCRQRSAFAALVASATAVLLIAPEQLFKIGFQLSYLVVASIILFGLPLNQWMTNTLRPFKWIPQESLNKYQRSIQWILNKLYLMFAVSFSAWAISAPLSLTYFGHLPVGAVLFNMVLVYLISLIVCVGTLSISCGILTLMPLSSFFNHGAWLLISITEQSVAFFEAINIIIIRSNYPATLSYLAVISFFVAAFYHNSQKTFKITRLLIAPSALLFIITSGLLIT